METTKAYGRVSHGRTWFTTNPDKLRQEAQQRACKPKPAVRVAVRRKPDGMLVRVTCQPGD